MLKIAVLISNAGTGTNLQAIIDAIESNTLRAKIVIVISGSKDAYGLERAKKHNIPSLYLEKKDNLEDLLHNKYKQDFIVLAGWKKIISPSMIKIFHNRIINLHPGLVPNDTYGVVKNPDGTNGLWNKGKMTDDAIKNFLDNNATYAGSSVHFLSDEFDFGPVLARCFEKINKNDTIETLYSRLKQKENKIYIETLIKLSQSHL